MPEGDDPANQYTRPVDIFAYGLLMLELISGRRLDRNGETGWQVGGAAASGAAPARWPVVIVALAEARF
jgi:hypothetical protein